MAELNETQVGRTEQKSDIFLILRKKPSGGVSIQLKSSVQDLFGDQIRGTIERALDELGVKDADVVTEDLGALDFVIRARVEAAVRRLHKVKEPGLLPERKAPLRAPARERLRRTRLYLPGNNPDLMLNAGLFGADEVILDLEDSVAPAEKDAARVLVRNTLMAVDFGGAETLVRINPLETEYGKADIEMIVPAGPDMLIIPKCNEAKDVHDVEALVAAVEKKHGFAHKILFMPLIETARGVLNAYEIARASDRVVAMCWGAEDLSADLGVERTKEGRESFVSRGLVILAAKAAGVQALDTVFSDVRDTAGLVESTKEAIALGFEGKGVIHPGQIEPIHKVFAPTPERIEYAQKVVAAIEKARAKGSGVAALGSKMIDAPIEARAKKILKLAEALGLIKVKKEGGGA
ncbi:MAG TPA: citrate lyase acyl carrier protein [Candidatus Bathyarchaeia archaeon]|nr:citrate lyase acyl carrier protein [Candidatus Bathyarchaeia archaeon]